MGASNIQVVWFKRDLRIRDHEPLSQAAQVGLVLPLFICEPQLWQQPDADPAQWEFQRQSLVDLRESLARLGAPLIVRTGDAVTLFGQLHDKHPIGRIWSHEETGNNWTFQRDRRVRAWARASGVPITETPNDLVVRRLSDRDDWGAISKARLSKAVLPAPSVIKPVEPLIDPGRIPTLDELGMKANTRTCIVTGGEASARTTMTSFLSERCPGYEKRLSSPVTAWDGCSRLSTHLTFGTLSLRELIGRTRRTASQEPAKRFSLKAFEERLHWRSHFIQKLEDEPSLEHHSYIPQFDGLRLDPSTNDMAAERFAAWAEGRTGYPMVDACMRALNETGWINFRMRAMLVSFASYDLWLDWRPTSLHLARAFVDYEPGIHYPQIQMQSGTTGINAIRIYDPVKQGFEHDPTGGFIRQWVPELRDVEEAVGASIHEPWILGDTFHGIPAGYPEPIVNHTDAVAYAWKQIERIRTGAHRTGQAAAVLEKHGSRRPPPARRRSR
jgi:deoxyribodipyrimidine photo-lyase